MKKHLPILDVKAAFVDVGSEHMHFSVGGDEPKVFGSVTSQLHALRDWLLAQDVRSVAMDATGRVLAAAVRRARSRGAGRAHGRWPPDAQRGGPQDRHAGRAVGCHAAHARPAARGLRAHGRHPPAAGLPAPARRPRGPSRQLRAADAKGAGAHERQAARRHQLVGRRQRHGRHAGHHRRRARPGCAAGAVRRADPPRQGRTRHGDAAWHLER